MKCDKVQNLLSEYNDGLLDWKHAAEVEAHIAKCAECARELRLLRASWSMVVEHVQSVEPPVGLWNGIYNRIISEEEHPARAWWPGALRSLRTAGAMVVTVGLVVGILYGTVFAPQGRIASMDPESAEYAQGHAIYAGQAPLADRVSYGSIVAASVSEAPGGSR